MSTRPEAGEAAAAALPEQQRPRGHEPGATSAVSAAPPARACARCGATIRWREVKFCLDRRARFGGRVYCQGCQPAFQVA